MNKFKKIEGLKKKKKKKKKKQLTDVDVAFRMPIANGTHFFFGEKKNLINIFRFQYGHHANPCAAHTRLTSSELGTSGHIAKM
jgi:hypothetical protein